MPPFCILKEYLFYYKEVFYHKPPTWTAFLLPNTQHRKLHEKMGASDFKQTLQMVTTLPETRLFNAVFPTKANVHAYEALLVSINRDLQQQDSFAILICDEGNEAIYTKLVRRLQSLKNSAIDRILEDPFFKQSDQSYFIQLSDFCAYALLRQERPIASKTKYGLDKAFNLLKPISEEIIRPDT